MVIFQPLIWLISWMRALYGRKKRQEPQILGRRLLTQELGVSQNTIQKALNQLERERLLISGGKIKKI